MARYLNRGGYHNACEHITYSEGGMHMHVRVDELRRQCACCNDAIQCFEPVGCFVLHEVRREGNAG
jgi:hypothetical protein